MEFDGEKYGYICMTCGKTIHEGTNSDGECTACVNYADKQNNKYIRYSELATKAKEQSKAAYERSNSAVAGIPFGQPILVGHHSEGAHRAALKRCHNAMDKFVELKDKSEHYENKAEATLNNNAISSDDPAAIKKLQEKLEKLETERQEIKDHNKKARAEGKEGSASWVLSNLGQNIRSVKQRIKYLERMGKMEEIEEKYGEITLKVDKEDNRVRLFFPGKPSEEIRSKLKGRGFRWSPYNGCWQRQVSDWAISCARDIAQEV